MKLGASPRQLAILGGLVLVGGYLLISNLSSSDSSGSSASTPSRAAAPPPAVAVRTDSDSPTARARRVARTRPGSDWNPGIDGKPLDPLKVDPTLRLDLLAKVQQVDVGGAQRNLFQFGDAAPAQVSNTPLPKVPKIPLRGSAMPPPVTPTGPPPKPAPPPITLKYYGFASPRSNPRKKAFFLDGDEIIVAAEGDMMKKRYRLLKIGINSVTVEDTQFNNNEQVLPLAEDAIG